MKIKHTILAFTALLALGFAACKDDNPAPENPEELITSLILNFVDSANASNTTAARFEDPDGPGGSSPTTFDTIVLQPNKTYFASIILLDESKTPVDTISNEVAEEKDDHLFTFSSTAGISILITDLDNNNLPVGLSTKWKTGTAATGNTIIRLKHQPGIKTGDVNLGETDVEVDFFTVVQ